jgi:hypothetical protein
MMHLGNHKITWEATDKSRPINAEMPGASVRAEKRRPYFGTCHHFGNPNNGNLQAPKPEVSPA